MPGAPVATAGLVGVPDEQAPGLRASRGTERAISMKLAISGDVLVQALQTALPELELHEVGRQSLSKAAMCSAISSSVLRGAWSGPWPLPLRRLIAGARGRSWPGPAPSRARGWKILSRISYAFLARGSTGAGRRRPRSQAIRPQYRSGGFPAHAHPDRNRLLGRERVECECWESGVASGLRRSARLPCGPQQAEHLDLRGWHGAPRWW